MDPRANQYIKDLHSLIEALPYGEIDIEVKRVNHKTDTLTTMTEETLRYVDNDEALKDFSDFILQLIETGYTGEATVKLTMKGGSIQLMSILDKKQTSYKG